MNGLEERATRFLAFHAFKAGAIDPETFDAIDEEPDCAEQCSEYLEWLNG